jgi:hypothetical protein
MQQWMFRQNRLENNESSFEANNVNNNSSNKSNIEREENKSDKPHEVSEEEKKQNQINNNNNLNKDNNNNNNEEKKNEDNNKNEKNNENVKMPEEYYPSNLIVILKESIKAFHKDINELIVKTTDEKKERNEASQLLQKCIDDINSEIKVLTRNSLLPNIKTNYLTYGYDNNIKSPNQNKVTQLEMKLVVLTFIFDNVFQNITNKKLYFISKNNPEKTHSKFGFKQSKNFRRTAY